MKTTNRKTVIIAALAILVFTAGLALAQGQGAGKYGKGTGQGRAQGQECRLGGPDRHWERMAEALELSDEQQNSIQELREANQTKNLELRKEMARVRNELEGELLKDDVDTKAALKLQQRLGDLRTEMQTNRLETRLAVREQLTPEQQDKMLAMKNGKGKRGGRQGRGGHGPRHGGSGQCRADND